MLQKYWSWRSAAQGGDVLIHALPIFHVHGLFVAIHGALINGSKMIWMAKFEPKTVLQAMPRATVFMGVPTLYVRLLNEPGLTPAVVRNMRLFVSGSAPMLIETFNDWERRTGHAILERYGMSETVMLTSTPATRRMASVLAAPWVKLCRVCNCAYTMTTVNRCRSARLGAYRSRGPMCSRAAGTCRKRRPGIHNRRIL